MELADTLKAVSRHTRGRWLIALVVCAGAASSGVAVLGGGVAAQADAVQPPAGPVIGPPVPVVTSVNPSDAAAIGLLRAPVTANDAVPAAVAAAANVDGITAAYGVNFALARQANGLTDGQAWVVPGDGALCLVVRGDVPGVQDANGSDSCGTAPEAVDGHMATVALSARAPGWLLVAGVVPDGVSDVTMHLAGGARVEVAVHDNVYLEEIQSTTIPEVEFAGPTGSVVPIPASALPSPSNTSAVPSG